MWGLIILVLCAFPSVVYSTGSSASNTIQPSKETDSQIENVKPLPLSSIVLFERNKTQLCLGVLITPFNILVSSSCYHLLHPHHNEEYDAHHEFRAVEVWSGIAYGRSRGYHFLIGVDLSVKPNPYPLAVVIMYRNTEYSKSEYESMVFIPEEINNNFLIPLLGAGIYNKKNSKIEQFGLVPMGSDGSLLFAKSLIGLIPEHMVWTGALVFFLNRFVGVLTAFFEECNEDFIYVIKTGFNCDDLLSHFHLDQTFNEYIHDPLISI